MYIVYVAHNADVHKNASINGLKKRKWRVGGRLEQGIEWIMQGVWSMRGQCNAM
jgi:hypothetical protein